jgi:signal transduction histidine kinase
VRVSNPRGTPEAATREKRIIGGLSHELRSPLNSIIGFSELLEQQLATTVSEKHHGYLLTIAASAREMLSLIELVVEVACIDSDASGLRQELTPLSEVASRCVQLTRERARALGVTVKVEEEPRPDAAVRTDPIRLLWGLYLLVECAVEHLEGEGEVVLDISREPAGDGAELRVIATSKSSDANTREMPPPPAHSDELDQADVVLRQVGARLERLRNGAESTVYRLTFSESVDAARKGAGI